MTDKEPFTHSEKEIMNSILDAHSKFVSLERMHPMEMEEWVSAIHRLQSIMSHRVVKRDYPEFFK